jgi:hypothetical protein
MPSTILTFIGEIVPGRRQALDQVLADLAEVARTPPHQPFSDIPTLHFASVVPFDTPGFTPLLVLECNFDGALEPFLGQLLSAAGPWLERLFACCEGFPAAAGRDGLADYLRTHLVRPAAYHIGNVGRRVERIRQEHELRLRLGRWLDGRLAAGSRPTTAPEAYRLLDAGRRADPDLAWVARPHARQSWSERIGPWARLIAIGGTAALTALLLAPLTILLLGCLLVVLRRHERRDVPMNPGELRPEHVDRLAAQEDHRVQNHLASMTVVKPNGFRRLLLRVVLWAANLVARTSTKGTLSGIPSIHYAHWALVDRGRRLLFLSNFDGSWESYLDDFIDKASSGLTAIWTNTEGFPRTRFLIREGARDGVAFKAFARQQQAPAAVWYSAYADLTVQQIDSHSLIREGLASVPRGAALAGWLRRW